MHSVHTRALEAADVETVGRLLDATLGAGYWDLDTGCPGSHRVAVADGEIVGIASACIVRSSPYVELAGPLGIVREVAVEPAERGRGIATRLVREVCAECARAGVLGFGAYAWVHATTGVAPLAGVLERLGFEAVRRVDGFYGGATAVAPCMGCGERVCVCPADVYERDARPF